MSLLQGSTARRGSGESRESPESGCAAAGRIAVGIAVAVLLALALIALLAAGLSVPQLARAMASHGTAICGEPSDGLEVPARPGAPASNACGADDVSDQEAGDSDDDLVGPAVSMRPPPASEATSVARCRESRYRSFVSEPSTPPPRG